MVVVSDASAGVSERVDAPSVVAERLEAFGVEVLAGAMNRPVQIGQRRLVSAGVDRAGCAQVA